MAKKPTQSERIEAVAEYAGTVATAIEDLMGELMDHMAPDVQRSMQQIRRDLFQAGRDLSDVLGE